MIIHKKKQTLMILYAVETSKIDPFKELYVMPPDTDGLVNFIYHCRLLCNKTVLITGIKDNTRCIDIYEVFEALQQGSPRILHIYWV